MSKDQAIEILKRTRELSTDLLKPLGISFESWLRFAQLPKDRADKMVDGLIDMLTQKEIS